LWQEIENTRTGKRVRPSRPVRAAMAATSASMTKAVTK
jgi:hypothetical protein